MSRTYEKTIQQLRHDIRRRGYGLALKSLDADWEQETGSRTISTAGDQVEKYHRRLADLCERHHISLTARHLTPAEIEKRRLKLQQDSESRPLLPLAQEALQ